MGIKISFYDPDDEKPSRKQSRESGFTLDWVSELGWKKDPFEEEAELADFEDERQQINLFFVKKKSYGELVGGEGAGKTSLINWLYSELSHYKGMRASLVRARDMQSAEELRMKLAEPLRGRFLRSKPVSTQELLEMMDKKIKDRDVLLVDDAHMLDEAGLKVISEIAKSGSSVLVATNKALKGMPTDELELTLAKRTSQQYEKILRSRIETAGGEGTRPYTKRVIERMAEDTESTREFLDLAKETAINIALKQTALDEDVEPEDLAEDEEKKAEKKKGIKPKKPEEKKRKYDELIESLTEGMD